MDPQHCVFLYPNTQKYANPRIQIEEETYILIYLISQNTLSTRYDVMGEGGCQENINPDINT